MRGGMKIKCAEVSALLVLSCGFAACTKKKSSTDNGAAPQPNQPVEPAPGGTAQPNPLENLPEFRYTVASLAGENVFCQDFISRSPLTESDVQTILNAFAGRQAGIPAELPNPFSLQTLALAFQSQACGTMSTLIADGHCAVTLSQLMATGQLSLETQQRILWKDLPKLAQAQAVKSSLDRKAEVISGKNTLLATIQQQVTQQKLLLQILQGAGNDSQLVQDAQKLLEQLQQQTVALSDELKGLEDELIPLQDELEKRLDELRVARASLKQSCSVAGLGAAGASWKDN